MSEVRLYGKNRKRLKHRRSYWTDIKAWGRSRLRKTGRIPTTVNVTSRAKDWGHELSPILLGPVNTYKEDGAMLTAVNVEVAWQYSKIYSHKNVDGRLVPLNFLNKNGRPNARWFRWRDRAWSNPRFRWGHPEFGVNKRLVRRAFPKGSTVAAWYWDGELLDQVTARREIYAQLYCRSVRKTPAYRRLQRLHTQGDVLVYDFDGYDHVALRMSPEDTIRAIDHSWGHGLLLTLLLQGVDPRKLAA
jgi:hypothetical protein